MTITNGYCTLTQLKDRLNITDTADDLELESAINAASRQIDQFCGRRFWQDADVEVREYYPDDSRLCVVDDISTTTGLIVKTDEDDDGTFETTLAISTNFILRPLNAADEVPVWPYTEIVVVDGSNYFPRPSSGRATVQVTARFGWPDVPPDVELACLIQARHLYKAQDATFGSFQLGADGMPTRIRPLDQTSEVLLSPYRKEWVG